MNKYVNGKFYKMTEEDKVKFKSRSANKLNLLNNTSTYEKRIKELENTVAALMTKLADETPAQE